MKESYSNITKNNTLYSNKINNLEEIISLQAQTTARLESLILNQLESIEKMQITLAKQDTVITHLVNRIKYLGNRNDVMEHMDNTENSQPSTTIQPPSYNNHLMSNKPNISQALKLKIDDYHKPSITKLILSYIFYVFLKLGLTKKRLI